MPDFQFQEILDLHHGEGDNHDETPYRLLTRDGVSTIEAAGRRFLCVEPAALTRLTSEAMRDIAHLLRPGHLQQLRRILDDPEASPNDKLVALDLLKNAGIAAGGVLPMCQDTGTAIVMGKRGERVLTGGGDESAIARGVFDTYQTSNLRYSQMAPLDMYKEVNAHRPEPVREVRDPSLDVGQIFRDHGERYLATHTRERRAFRQGQPTVSYYGPINWVGLDVGHHIEHHDLLRAQGPPPS